MLYTSLSPAFVRVVLPARRTHPHNDAVWQPPLIDGMHVSDSSKLKHNARLRYRRRLILCSEVVHRVLLRGFILLGIQQIYAGTDAHVGADSFSRACTDVSPRYPALVWQEETFVSL